MKEKEILNCEKILHNFDDNQLKLAATSEVTSESKYQLLSIVTSKDEIIIRYVSETSEIILKKIDWFFEKKKIIKGIKYINIGAYLDSILNYTFITAVAFDPFPSTWLLVLCIDNTVRFLRHRHKKSITGCLHFIHFRYILFLHFPSATNLCHSNAYFLQTKSLPLLCHLLDRTSVQILKNAQIKCMRAPVLM